MFIESHTWDRCSRRGGRLGGRARISRKVAKVGRMSPKNSNAPSDNWRLICRDRRRRASGGEGVVLTELAEAGLRCGAGECFIPKLVKKTHDLFLTNLSLSCNNRSSYSRPTCHVTIENVVMRRGLWPKLYDCYKEILGKRNKWEKVWAKMQKQSSFWEDKVVDAFYKQRRGFEGDEEVVMANRAKSSNWSQRLTWLHYFGAIQLIFSSVLLVIYFG